MNITKSISGSETTLVVEGWLDTQSAPELHDAVEGVDQSCEKLIIDLSGLEYISSSGVREIVGAYKMMRGALVVKNTSAGIMSIFKATGIDKKITFE